MTEEIEPNENHEIEPDDVDEEVVVCDDDDKDNGNKRFVSPI